MKEETENLELTGLFCSPPEIIFFTVLCINVFHKDQTNLQDIKLLELLET